MKTKKLSAVTLMLATFMLAIPATPPVLGSTPCPSSPTGCVYVDNGSAGLGQTFSVNVNVLGSSSVIAYDIRVFYDPNILQVVSTDANCPGHLCGTLGNTAFDLNHNGNIGDEIGAGQVLIARDECLNSIGRCRIAITLQGGLHVSLYPTPAPVYTITFKVNNPLKGTASELPSSISPGPNILVGLDSGGDTVVIAHSNVAGSFTPANTIGIRSTGCRATTQGFNLKAHGFTDGMFCRIVNNGAVAADVSAVFSWESLNHVVGSCSAGPVSLAAGQNGELDCSITLPGGVSSTDIFIVTGTMSTVLTFPDSTTFVVSGPSESFSIIVNG